MHKGWASRIESVMRDVRSGFLGIRRDPGVSLMLLLTLALGIGANTAIFSAVYAVLLQRPPYPAGERMVELHEAVAGQDIPVSWINFQRWRQENHSFEEMAGFENADLTLTGHGDAMLTHAGVVSASFFRMTGTHPIYGRLFNEGDDRAGAAPTVVVTSDFWARIAGEAASAAGKMLLLDGKAYEVIGVLAPGLRFFTRPVDFYIALGPREGNTVQRSEHGSMLVLGLLKAGTARKGARADLDAIMQRLGSSEGGVESEHRTSIQWLAEAGLGDIRQTLLLLMAAVGLVLLIACANVASILVARSTARARELAIRMAMGAGRSRLARQLFTENLVIAGLGGMAGLLLARMCLHVLVATAPGDIPRLWDADLNGPVLMFTAGVTLITGLLAGLGPILNSGKLDLTTALKEGSAGTGASARGHSLRSALVVAEIAVTLVLSFACGVLLRSLALAEDSSPGFRSESVLALELQLPPSRYKTEDAERQFYERLMEELGRRPGVESVGAMNCPPPTGGCARGWYSIADMPAPARAEVPLTLLSTVDSGYFRTVGMSLLAGRNFTKGDRAGVPGVVVINETLARHWWKAAPQLAVGHPIKLGGPYMDGPTYQIVGIVNDVNQEGLGTAPLSEIYVPFAQSPSAAMVVMIRGSGNPARLTPGVRRALTTIDSNVAIQSLRPFSQWMGETLERRRFGTLLIEIFAALALTLSAVGIYGVLSQWVSMREKEIAIRLALGATRPEIVHWAGGHGLRLVALGSGLGVLGGWGASLWLQNVVFGISARSPAMLLAAGTAVLGVGVLAAGVPIWRATKIDAIRSLRDA